MRFLLDTHVLLRWLSEPRKVTREQRRVIERAERSGLPLGVSAMSLVEAALLMGRRSPSVKISNAELLQKLESAEVFEVIPIDFEVALEIGAVSRWLSDPADCTIVATARSRGLQLLTSDQRIIDSGLVVTVA